VPSAATRTFEARLPLVLAGAYFIYSARTEERILAQELPEQYADYRKRTKMLVPFLCDRRVA
jgi:protein-S-isoprenylcysteine O-methyltransferase Ste14